MKNWIMWGSLAVVAGLSACDDNNEKLNAKIILESQFQTSTENWTGGFADFGSDVKPASLDTAFARTYLPAAIDSTKYGLKIQGSNRSDDMFMYVKKKVTGLIPNRDYKVAFDIDLGTKDPENGIGAGGSPGGSVYLKAGASAKEPVTKLVNGFYKNSIDKGDQSQGGKEMVVLGNIANGLDKDGYKLVPRSNQDNPVSVKANEKGEIWLCVGTDSGYEGLTVLYYDRIKATIIEQFSN